MLILAPFRPDPFARPALRETRTTSSHDQKDSNSGHVRTMFRNVRKCRVSDALWSRPFVVTDTRGCSACVFDCRFDHRRSRRSHDLGARVFIRYLVRCGLWRLLGPTTNIGDSLDIGPLATLERVIDRSAVLAVLWKSVRNCIHDYTQIRFKPIRENARRTYTATIARRSHAISGLRYYIPRRGLTSMSDNRAGVKINMNAIGSRGSMNAVRGAARD
jgi:hypothetical protein